MWNPKSARYASILVGALIVSACETGPVAGDMDGPVFNLLYNGRQIIRESQVVDNFDCTGNQVRNTDIARLENLIIIPMAGAQEVQFIFSSVDESGTEKMLFATNTANGERLTDYATRENIEVTNDPVGRIDAGINTRLTRLTWERSSTPASAQLMTANFSSLPGLWVKQDLSSPEFPYTAGRFLLKGEDTQGNESTFSFYIASTENACHDVLI